MLERMALSALFPLLAAAFASAGPYTEAGINGYINPQNLRHANPLSDANAVINPIFRCWATGVKDYVPADNEWFGPGVYNDPNKALGPASGENIFDVVSLGDLDRDEIDRAAAPGQITLVFGDPCEQIDADVFRDVKGYDFVVFENAFVSLYSTHGGSVSGQMLAEFGYVEVSSNGEDFARFPAVSLTSGPVGPYGTIEISNVYNLAGKHPNANGICTGTPFDLQEIADDPNVISGVVDINNIRYVRIVDIPGSGDFVDEAIVHIDPNTQPQWNCYESNHPIYDAWVTFGSGGLDLEAVGVLKEQEHSADINLDGKVDMFDFALLASAWRSHFGQADWIARCDLAEAKDYVIDAADFAVFASQWLKVEKWRNK